MPRHQEEELQCLAPGGFGEGVEEVVVICLVGDEEEFGAGVIVVEFLAEFCGHHGVSRGEDDHDGALVVFEPVGGGVLVAQDPADGEEGVVVLRDVGQVVEGSEEEEAGDAVGDSRGGGGGDAGAD